MPDTERKKCFNRNYVPKIVQKEVKFLRSCKYCGREWSQRLPFMLWSSCNRCRVKNFIRVKLGMSKMKEEGFA